MLCCCICSMLSGKLHIRTALRAVCGMRWRRGWRKTLCSFLSSVSELESSTFQCLFRRQLIIVYRG